MSAVQEQIQQQEGGIEIAAEASSKIESTAAAVGGIVCQGLTYFKPEAPEVGGRTLPAWLFIGPLPPSYHPSPTQLLR
ncbi:MAG: hypothetical protein JWO47_80 [Candidatus Saccharibacteria bacterium]|nr:hypothetical protein [Candidatus Saccharibacteria bacterium]